MRIPKSKNEEFAFPLTLPEASTEGIPSPRMPTALLSVLGWVAIVSSSLAIESGKPPRHILIFLADDLGWGQLACHGHRGVETPHLDSLAASGIDLEICFSCPEGGPSRAALLTGRYPFRTGVSGSQHGEGTMQAFQVTVAEVLRDAGWRTAAFGKWQNGANWPHCPEAQGFDTFEGYHGRRPGDFDRLTGNSCLEDPLALAKSVTAFLDERKEEPAPRFTYVAFSPLVPAGTSPAGTHDAIARLDAGIGHVLSWLEASGLSEETLVWFLADNGPLLGPGAEAGRENAFLRGGRGSVHEGGVRVPSLLQWPGRIETGSKFSRITALMDVMPTVIEIAGLDRNSIDLPRLDGISLAPVLLGGGRPGRWPNRVLLNAWTPPGFGTDRASVSVHTDRWIALRDPRWRRGPVSEHHSGWELYDLDADPYQRTELAEDYPFLLSDLRADFSRWMDHTTDDGLGPIATEIGHLEWPIVALDRDSALFQEDGRVRLAWPIEIIGEASLELSVEIATAARLTDSEPLRLRLGTVPSETMTRIDLIPDPESAAWHQATTITLEAGNHTLSLEGDDLESVLGIRLHWTASAP